MNGTSFDNGFKTLNKAHHNEENFNASSEFIPLQLDFGMDKSEYYNMTVVHCWLQVDMKRRKPDKIADATRTLWIPIILFNSKEKLLLVQFSFIFFSVWCMMAAY